MIPVPFTVICDQQEGLPYSFRGLRADADRQRRILDVQTVKRHLETGDYSILGLTGLVTIERKSMVDLFGSCGGGHDRFKREHERMASMKFAAVMIEGSLKDALKPPDGSRMLPKSVIRMSIRWPVKYGVHWIWAGNRELAEILTFRALETFWNIIHNHHNRKEVKHAHRRHAVTTIHHADPATCPF